MCVCVCVCERERERELVLSLPDLYSPQPVLPSPSVAAGTHCSEDRGNGEVTGKPAEGGKEKEVGVVVVGKRRGKGEI